jgi:opacity protein-like surface antigen
MKEPILVTCNTCDLEGAALDWAVAFAEGIKVVLAAPAYGNGWRVRYDLHYSQAKYSPSSDWSQGGPLIDKHRLGFGIYADHYFAVTGLNEQSGAGTGANHLTSACRAVVASAFGDAVSVPKELLA